MVFLVFIPRYRINLSRCVSIWMNDAEINIILIRVEVDLRIKQYVSGY